MDEGLGVCPSLAVRRLRRPCTGQVELTVAQGVPVGRESHRVAAEHVAVVRLKAEFVPADGRCDATEATVPPHFLSLAAASKGATAESFARGGKAPAAFFRRSAVPTEASSRIRSASYSPEFNIFIFAALLHLPWEFLQVPFFSGMPQVDHWQGIRTCVRATLGDVVIMLMAYWIVAIAFRRRYWLSQPTARELFLFVATGVGITVLIERMALAGIWLGGWAYSERMYMIPLLEVGLSPVLQWLLLPPLVAWLARRQIAAGGPQTRQGSASGAGRTPLELGVAAHYAGKTGAGRGSARLQRKRAGPEESFTSCVFLLDRTGEVEFLPHSVYVALARAEAVVPRFAGKTFRLADWYVRDETGRPPELVNEWYGWVRFDDAGAFDPTASPAEDGIAPRSTGNVDVTALPTKEERARMQETLASHCDASAVDQRQAASAGGE